MGAGMMYSTPFANEIDRITRDLMTHGSDKTEIAACLMAVAEDLREEEMRTAAIPFRLLHEKRRQFRNFLKAGAIFATLFAVSIVIFRL